MNVAIETPEDLRGQAIDGRFPLIERIGATKHSSTFITECREAANGKAAIKIFIAPTGDFRAQLNRWRLAARLSHPALLRIFDMGRCEVDSRPTLYVVTEYAEENLSEVLRVRCLSSDEAGVFLGQSLDALGFLHGKGLAHGGIQPSNILAIGDRVKFSIDRVARVSEAEKMREAREPYRAPEAICSPAADVWSLGITLVQCLTGRVPERTAEGRRGVAVPENMPAPFFEVARHCLNPIPQRRWSVDQLRAALAGGEIATTEINRIEGDRTRPERASAAEFVRPSAAAPVRRRSLKKRYQLALAAAATVAAAFVLGIVISGSAYNSVTEPAAPQKSTAAREPGAARPTPLQPANKTAQPVETAASRRPGIHNGARGEKSAPKRSGELNPIPAVITTQVKPNSSSGPNVRPDGVMQGRISERALPRIPARASDTITGTVRVSVVVDVDPRGRVVEAKLDSVGPSRYFARLSFDAARDWKFRPPKVGGNSVPSEWIIDFGYTKDGTSATALERHP